MEKDSTVINQFLQITEYGYGKYKHSLKLYAHWISRVARDEHRAGLQPVLFLLLCAEPNGK